MIGLPATIQQCSNGVHPETVTAIIRHESGGNPIAMNIEGATVIPADLAEAIRIQGAALAAGKSIDTGLMQINSQWIKRLRIAPERLFDPCVNIQIGSTILRRFYSITWANTGNMREALIGALSMYNTGSATAGYGYVQKVVLQAGKALVDRSGTPNGAVQKVQKVTPQNAPTGFPMQAAWSPSGAVTKAETAPAK